MTATATQLSGGSVEPPLATARASTALLTKIETLSQRVQMRSEPMAQPLLNQKLHGEGATPLEHMVPEIDRTEEGTPRLVISFCSDALCQGVKLGRRATELLADMAYFGVDLSDRVVGFLFV